MFNKIKRTLRIFIVIPAILLMTHTAHAGPRTCALMKFDGAVNPIVADYIEESIDRAAKDGAEFIVLQMNTPGGFMNSMRSIIEAIQQSKIPVVVYAYPKGAQAASAGGFIMLSAHVAVMSPGSEIGAMHPIASGLDFMKKDEKGDPAGVMEKKLLNDTAAFARSLAQLRKRNEQWAERAVREAISSSYTEAERDHVVDFIAEDMDELLKKLDNREVSIQGRVIRLHTEGIIQVSYGMQWYKRAINHLVNAVANPEMMLLLLILAVVGIGIELKNPGMIFPGTLGTMALILFLLTTKLVPVNVAGVLFIVLSVILFILELKITSYGLLTIGGILCFAFGAMILFPSPQPGGHMSIVSIIVALLTVLAFVFLLLRAVLNAQKKRITTGSEGMIGEKGEAIRAFYGKGKVRVHGEIWNAVASEEIKENEEVAVVEVRGMDLYVKKYDK